MQHHKVTSWIHSIRLITFSHTFALMFKHFASRFSSSTFSGVRRFFPFSSSSRLFFLCTSNRSHKCTFKTVQKVNKLIININKNIFIIIMLFGNGEGERNTCKSLLCLYVVFASSYEIGLLSQRERKKSLFKAAEIAKRSGRWCNCTIQSIDAPLSTDAPSLTSTSVNARAFFKDSIFGVLWYSIARW